MRRIEKQSKRMGMMVEELLELARLGEGRQPESAPVDLARVASDAIADGSAVPAVVDEGPGLPDGEIERVFEPFYRADPSRTRDTGGAGLGLAIVAAIVEAHGGTVAAASPPGAGATFSVRLPLAAAET